MSGKATKKILYVITKSNFGGAQRYVFELAEAMSKAGHQVAVAAGGHGDLMKKLQALGIQTYCITGLERDISAFKELQALYSLSRIIKEYAPDVVHLNSTKAGLLGSLIARIMRVNCIVFTAHGWPFLEPRPRWWQAMAWLGSYLTAIFSHRVIVVSRYDLDHTNMPGILKKCQVIHPAVSEFTLHLREPARNALFPLETIDDHRHNIWLVTLAELNHNKNHSTAIDAVAEFNSSHQTKIFYTIIGTGDLLSELKEQVALKGLGEYVNFLGYIENARQYLLAFDMFTLPSKKEGLPYALLEAGLAKLPCIASRVGGIEEIIENYQSGLFINPNNHMTIIAALDYLLTNADKRVQYSEALAEHIKKDFAFAQMFANTLAVYTL